MNRWEGGVPHHAAESGPYGHYRACYRGGVDAAEQREMVAVLNDCDCKIELHRQKRTVLLKEFKALYIGA